MVLPWDNGCFCVGTAPPSSKTAMVKSTGLGGAEVGALLLDRGANMSELFRGFLSRLCMADALFTVAALLALRAAVYAGRW